MNNHSIFNIRKLFKTFGYAFNGLKEVFKSEVAFRQELLLSVIIIPAAFFLGKTPVEKVLLISSWLLVLLVEIINSAIEAIIDRIGLDAHFLSKKAKDIGCAAVLMAITIAIVVWCIILF
jgi:diacylglycerol kinase (ATP)